MRFGIVIAVTLLLASCGNAARPSSPTTPDPTVALTPRPPDLPVATPPSVSPPSVTPPSITDVPASILESVTGEAARLSGVPVDQIAVTRAEPFVWPNGALGCPQPGEMYTQALVDGYWIVLEVAGVSYDFRVANDGSFRLCQVPHLSNPAGGVGPY